MKLVCLVENTCSVPGLEGEHGLSLYLEQGERKVLFDVGKTGLFLKNAALLGVDLRRVDTVVLSHGHYDHGGGLLDFLALNPYAAVWMQKGALERHYSRRASGEIADIGLAPELEGHPQVLVVDGNHGLQGGMFLFSRLQDRLLWSEANRVLLERDGDGYREDPFFHEQHLLIQSDTGKLVLLAGCAHRGIVNIVSAAAALCGRAPDVVIGGFHLSIPSQGKMVSPELVTETARQLLRYPSQYYTCHCTGTPAFELMKEQMGDRLCWLSTGTTLTL